MGLIWIMCQTKRDDVPVRLKGTKYWDVSLFCADNLQHGESLLHVTL